MRSINILDIPIQTLSKSQVVEQIMSFDTTGHLCATPNAEILLRSLSDSSLQNILQKSALNCPDSVSLLWAGQCINNKYSTFRSLLELVFLPIRKPFWKQSFPELVPGSDLYLALCEKASGKGASVFLLGGQGAVPEANAQNLQTRFPHLRINGYLEGSPHESEDKKTQTIINNSGAELLFVAFGCPHQEKWLKRNLPHLPHVKAGIGIGGSFDFVAGYIPRAPRIMRKLGLEWAWRLLQQPSRYKRIVDATIVFPYKFLKWKKSTETVPPL